MTDIALLTIAFLFFLLIIEVPVAFAMLIAGAVGIYATGGMAPLVGVLKQAPYEHVMNYTISTLPMFVLMGEFLTAGRFTRDLFDASNRWLSAIKGGVLYSALAGGVMLSAITGSSTAAAAMLASSSYPEMKRLGYDSGFSMAAVAIIGTLAIMLPPSIALVLYGIFTETSVGALFIAGIVPGAITGIGYFFAIFFIIRRKPHLAPDVVPLPPLRQRIEGLKGVWPIILLMVVVIIAIYSGAITTTEVGAVGAFAALVICIAMRRIGWKEFLHATRSATLHSVMILTIIAFSAVFGIFLTMTGTTQALLQFVQDANIPAYWVLAFVVVMLLILGFFLDQTAVLVLTLPLTFPLLTELGYHPVWLGIIYVKTCEIGMISPPMGINVFVVSSTTGVPPVKIFGAIWPFVATELLILLILILFPALSLWMPSLM